jgi:polysaccharide pyruvyl transferase WcaK-like protein
MRNSAVLLPRGVMREIAFLVSALRIIGRVDLLIVSGGGHLTGKSGPWGYPYGILTWFLAARLTGTRRMLLNVGAGPLSEPLTKFFVLRALHAANYVSFRDEPSQALVRSIGFPGESRVFPDVVYSLDLSPAIVRRTSRNGKPVVGVSPLAYPSRSFHIAEHKAAYDAVIAKFAAFTSSLMQRGYAVELFGTDIGEDPATIEDLRRVLRDRYGIDTAPFSPTSQVEELLRNISRMDYVVTCRFHGVVFAHLLNKPILAVSPHRKVSDLMSALGLSRYSADIRTFDPSRLTELFDELVRDRSNIENRLADRLVQYRLLLEKQLDSLFPPSDVIDDSSAAFSLRDAGHKNSVNIQIKGAVL